MMADKSSTGKLGICQLCESNIAQYKCPGCGACSCSLSCVRKHKSQTGCSGLRNKVQYVGKEYMDNFTLLSDYRFLEEIDHKLEDDLRNPLRRAVTKEKETIAELPIHLRKLKSEAKKRGTVIEFMPRYFAIHKHNSTRFCYADKKIRWHVKWVFPQAGLSFSEKSVDEETLLYDVLKKYMEPPNRLDEPSILVQEELDKLSYYHSASYRGIEVLFKSQLCKFDKTWVEMDLSRSLKFNLSKRKVVEYPVLYVVLKIHLDSYLQCESEDENEEDKFTECKSEALQNLNEDLRRKLRIQKPVRDKGTNKNDKLSFFETFSDTEDSE